MNENKSIFDVGIEKLAFIKIKDLKERQNLSYTEIAKILRHEGFSGVGDNELTQPVVSRFMLEHGYRVLDRKPRKGGNGRAGNLKGYVVPAKDSRPEFNLQKDINLAMSTQFSKVAQALILDTLVSAYKKEAGL